MVLVHVADGRLRTRAERIIAQGGWCSWRELLSKKDDQSELDKLWVKNRIFTAQVPVRQFTNELRFYHSLNLRLKKIMGLNGWPKRDEDIVDAVALPSGLSSSLAEKLEKTTGHNNDTRGAFYRSESVVSFAHMMRAVLPVTELLERFGLFAVRPRPDYGIMYPCSWAVHRYPRIAVQQFIFEIDFTGSISTRMIPWLDDGPVGSSDTRTVYYNPGKGCRMNMDRGKAVVVVECVAYASVDTETLELMHTPTRDSILAETADTISTCANKRKVVTPFVSSEPQPFRVLNSH